MATVLTGRLTITCDTDAEYTKALADVQMAGVYFNITSDPVSRTISFDVNQIV